MKECLRSAVLQRHERDVARSTNSNEDTRSIRKNRTRKLTVHVTVRDPFRRTPAIDIDAPDIRRIPRAINDVLAIDPGGIKIPRHCSCQSDEIAMLQIETPEIERILLNVDYEASSIWRQPWIQIRLR